MRASLKYILSLTLLYAATPALAQPAGQAPADFIVPRIQGAIAVDGRVDEPAWTAIPPLPLVTHEPVFGEEPSEPTEIRVAYDDAYFYVSCRCYGNPDRISATSFKRDQLTGESDYLGILLDTYNDNENGVGFFTSPTGARIDFAVSQDAEGVRPLNLDWNTYWDAAARQTDEGWFVEMRIPFSSLRFETNEGSVVMGFSVQRFTSRTYETAIYPAIPPTWGSMSWVKPSTLIDVVFDEVQPRRPLYLTPYVLGGLGQEATLDEFRSGYLTERDPIRDVGLDVKYTPSTNLNLDVTANTDFAQVEADDEILNLSRFSLFFPEKRAFFQERASVFDFNYGDRNSLFYSRRIGLHGTDQVRILGGVRLVGRFEGWDVGALSMQTEKMSRLDLSSENFGVVRIRRRAFNENSYVGGMLTTRLAVEGGYNIGYGVDAVVRLRGDGYALVNLAQTLDDAHAPRLSVLDVSRVRIGLERRRYTGLTYSAAFNRSGRGYWPEMGYEQRFDYSSIETTTSFGWIAGDSRDLHRYRTSLRSGFIFRNSDSVLETFNLGPAADVTFKSGAAMHVWAPYWRQDLLQGFQITEEVGVPAGTYTYAGIDGGGSTPPGRTVRLEYLLTMGGFYDGWLLSLAAAPTWVLSSRFELGTFYQLNQVVFPDRRQELTAHVARVRLQATLNTQFAFAAFVQYNSAADLIVTNLRFRYNPREGNDFYIVYNEGLNMDRLSYSPVPPLSGTRAVIFKYTYTFIR